MLRNDDALKRVDSIYLATQAWSSTINTHCDILKKILTTEKLEPDTESEDESFLSAKEDDSQERALTKKSNSTNKANSGSSKIHVSNDDSDDDLNKPLKKSHKRRTSFFSSLNGTVHPFLEGVADRLKPRSETSNKHGNKVSIFDGGKKRAVTRRRARRQTRR